MNSHAASGESPGRLSRCGIYLDSFLTSSRITAYPALLCVAATLVFALNIFLGHGWQGRSGKLLAFDFVVFNGIGELYRRAPLSIYDFKKKLEIEQELVAPAPHPDTAPNSFPPYMAPVFGLLRSMSLVQAAWLWMGCSLAFLAGGVFLLAKDVPLYLQADLSIWMLLLLTVATPAALLGLNFGQIHCLVFALVCGICHASLRNKPLLAGLLAGMLMFKPQYALGFFVLWLFRLELKAFAGAAISLSVYVVPALVAYGLSDFFRLWKDYFATVSTILTWMASDVFPSALAATPYSFFVRHLPPAAALTVTNVIGLLLIAVIGAAAYKCRNVSLSSRPDLLALAVLFPVLGSPYVMLYDLVVLVPVLILLLKWGEDRTFGAGFRRTLIWAAAVGYAGMVFLPIASYATGNALVFLLPAMLLGICLREQAVRRVTV